MAIDAMTGLGLMPHDEELEKVVLGSMLLEKSCLIDAIDLITSQTFFTPAHREIANIIRTLYEKGIIADIVILCSELDRRKLLDKTPNSQSKYTPFYISGLTSRIGSNTNVIYHIRMLQELEIKRRIIIQSQNNAKRASDPMVDAFFLSEEVNKETSEILDIVVKNQECLPMKLYEGFMSQLEAATNNEGKIAGRPSGIATLDAMTNGWQNGNFVIWGARPAMGKTGLVLTDIRNGIKLTREPACFFSLEMPAIELMGRLIAMETGVSMWSAFKGKTDDRYFEAAQRLASDLYDKEGNPLLIVDDTPALSIFDIKARAKKYHQKYGFKIMYIDYLGLCVRSSATQEQVKRELSIIGKTCKQIAKELNIPVIGLAQLNRDVEKQPSKRPELMHLRDSGTLEEDADQVIFLYRAEYYHQLTKREEFKEVEIDGQIVSSDGIGELIIAKYRNGMVGSAFTDFVSDTTEWKDRDLVNQYANGVF